MRRIIGEISYFIIFILLLILIDYVGVVNIHQAPRYALVKISGENMIYYNTLFYDVYRCDKDSKFETFNVVKKGKFDDSYCDRVVEERINKSLGKALEKTEVIKLYIYTEKKDSEGIIHDEFNGNYYVLNKTISNKVEIENIINLLSNSRYTELIDDILYFKLFRLYDSDYNLILEFNYNILSDFEAKETLGIYFDDDTKIKLEEYFN